MSHGALTIRWSCCQVLSVFQEKRIISDETARFEELLVRQRDYFVEEELKEKYRRLISFVQQTEATMSSEEAGELSSGSGCVPGLHSWAPTKLETSI